MATINVPEYDRQQYETAMQSIKNSTPTTTPTPAPAPVTTAPEPKPAPQTAAAAPAMTEQEQKAQDVFTGVNMFPTAEETSAAVGTLPGVQQALKEQYADILTLQYPRWEKKIQKARSYGYSDEQIRDYMNGKEAKSLMYYKQDVVNDYLQRTPEGMALAAAAERRRMVDAYVQASGLEREDVEDRMFVANMLMMPASLFVNDEELYKKLKPEIEQRLNKMRQAWWNTEPGIWGNVAAPTIAGAGQTLNSTLLKGTGFIAAQAAPAYNDTIRWGIQLLQPFLNDIGLTPEKTAAFYSRENNAIEQAAKLALRKGNEYGKAISEWYTQQAGENPSFVAETMHGVGSSLAFLVSVLTNPLYGASMESLGEAGDVMAKALESGKYDQAITPAALSFITNMVANYAWDKMGFFNPLLDKIKNPYLRGWARVISEVPFEIGQESGQEVISNTADKTVEQGGSLIDYAKNLWEEGKDFWNIVRELAPTVGASTVITGGVGATIRGRMEAKQEKQEREAYEAAKKEWDSLTPEQKAEKNKEIREAIITEASKNPMFHTEEAEAARDTITKRYMDIGMDEELARAEAEVETSAGIVMLARESNILIEKNGQKVKPTLEDMTNIVVKSWMDDVREMAEEIYGQIIGEKGAAKLDAEDAGNRIDNLGVAREMEQAGKDAKTIWLATGWAKGKEGKWNYDLMDGEVKLPDFSGLTEEEKRQKTAIYEKFKKGDLPEEDIERFKALTNKHRENVNKVLKEENGGTKAYKLGDIYDAPELYNAYPDLKDTKVYFRNFEDDSQAGGYGYGRIFLNASFLWQQEGKNEIKSTLVHEIQHAIQRIEGFAAGGNEKSSGWAAMKKYAALSSQIEELERRQMELPHAAEIQRAYDEDILSLDTLPEEDVAAFDAMTTELGKLERQRASMRRMDNFEAYKRLAGETQARNASARMDMTAEERRQKLLSETEDVAREDQIVLMDALGVAESREAETRSLKTQSGVSIENADVKEMLVTPEGSTTLSVIDDAIVEEIRKKTGVALEAGEIQANVGALRHAERDNHGNEIREATKFKDLQTFLLYALENWKDIYEGNNGALWLTAPINDGHHSVAVVTLDREKNGVYRVNTMMYVSDNSLKNKRKLYTGRPIPATSSGPGLNAPLASPAKSGGSSLGYTSKELSLNPSLQQPGQTVNATQRSGTVENGYISGWTHGKPGQEAWNVPSVITFLQTANASTGFHELGHHMLRLMMDISKLEGASAQIREDVNTILTHAGVTQEEFDTDREKRKQAHEYFAMSFETYLSEGKAPTPELQGVFDRIREWMIEVYHDVVKALGIELSDEMRDVFDRLLATPDQLAEQRRIGSLAMEELARRDEMKRTAEEIKELEAEAETEEASYPKDWDEITDEEGASYPADWDEITGPDDSREEYAQIIGGRGAARLDEAEGSTIRQDNYQIALKMREAGKDAKAIKLATGWDWGADGEPRYEILDGDLRLGNVFNTPEKARYHRLLLKNQAGTLTQAERAELKKANEEWARGNREGQRFKLPDVYENDELYEAYPELRDVNVRLYPSYLNGGVWEADKKRIILSLDKLFHPSNRENWQFKHILAHEIQHAIQDIEGFARGAGIVDGYERYAGEVESRNVQWRMDMTEEERRNTPLVDTEDVRREDQILMGGGVESYAQTQPNAPAQMTESEIDEMTRDQIDAVRDRYKGTPQWMKAPNGKATNLTEKQWLQVRTDAFKQWFGDWEVAAAAANPHAPNPRIAKSITEATELVRSSGILNTDIENIHLGITASISGRGLSKMGSEKATKKSVSPRLHALAIANVDRLFKTATLDLTHSDIHERQEVDQVRRLGSVMLDPETSSYVPVMLTVIEYRNNMGRKIYSIEAVNVGEYEKNSAGQLADAAERGDQAPITEFIKRIANLAQTVNNASKVVDENGEPLVVYHGSNSEFSVFDLDKTGYNTGNKGFYGNGFYTTNIREAANYYIGKKNRNYQEGVGGVMELFVNIKKPFYWDTPGGFEVAQSIGFPRKAIREFREMLGDKKAKKLPTLYKENEILDFTQRLKDNGYDGVIASQKNSYWGGIYEEYVAFNPEQIKSATDNRGTFDAGNPDIYYQDATEAPAASEGTDTENAASATEAVDDYNAQMEDYNIKLTAREYVETVARLIRQNGGLRLADFIHDVGEEAAKELRKKWPGLFRNTTQGPQLELDVLTQQLQANGIDLDVRGLVDWLTDTLNEKPAKPTPPTMTAKTLKATVEKYGAEAASQYLKERKRYLEGLIRKSEDPAALRILTKELRAIDRMIAGEKAARQRNALKEHYLEWINRLKGKLIDADIRRRLELGSQKAKADTRLQQLKNRYKAMAERKAERKKLGVEIDKTVRSINRMAETESISWDRQQEIKALLEGYDLKRRSRKTRDRRAEVEALLETNYLDAQDARGMSESELAFLGITQKDLKYIGATTLNDMTLADLKELQAQVSAVFEQGKTEFEAWEAERQERRGEYRDGLKGSLDKKEGPEPKVVATNKELGKQYEGIRGALAKVKDGFYSAVMTPDRFFDWLDGGHTKYKGAFVRYFVDALNAAKDEAKRHEQERLNKMKKALNDLGFKMSDFSKKAADAAGRSWTWNEIMEIYIGMRNEKKARAILFGNFVNGNGQGPVMSVEEAQNTIRKLVGLLTPEHKQAAELVVQDHDANFNRINRKFIEAFNRGMEQEVDYSSIHRMEHQTRQGLIDVEDEAAMTRGLDNAAIMKRVETGFMQNRQEIADNNQAPIMLGLFSNWMNDVSRHEHAAAMAQIAGDLASAMLSRGEEGRPLMKQLSDKFGKDAARTLASFFDDSVTDGQRLAVDFLDSLSSKVARNMSVAYIAGNCGTVLKQLTSIPRFLITAGPMKLTWTTFRFLTNPKAFLERAYELDPQLADRGGNALMNAVLRDPEWGKAAYQRGLEWMFAPVSIVDRWVAAIGWTATYEANLAKGATQEHAIREAQRAVRLTQQAASAKDLPRFWRSGGYVKTVMAFTSDTAATLGMTAYDLVQQLTSGEMNTTMKAFSTAFALAVTAIAMKAATDGISGDDDDDEDGGVGAWLGSALTEEFITSLPLVGKEAMMLYEELSGKYRGTTYSAFLTPVVKLLKGLDLMFDEDSEEEQFWKASGMLLDSIALSGIAPIPSTAIRRAVQSAVMLDEGDAGNAARTLFGMRVRREE